MFRLMGLTSWGKRRVREDVPPRDSPWTMTLPLALLAIAALVWLGYGISNS